jgi:hypothetical protein
MIFIALFVMLYISFVAWTHARKFLITALTMISGLALTNIYAGQPAMILVLVVSPVLYIVGVDAVEKLRSIKLSFAWFYMPRIEKQFIEPELVEAAPLKGEFISGNTPEIEFKQPLLGDVEALPKPWL